MNTNEKIKKDQPFSEQELNLLREKFLTNYCKEKGWNSNNLSSNQMLEIVSHKNYKNPGLILG